MESWSQAVRRAILERKTEKVLGDPACPLVYTQEQLAHGDAMVLAALRDCGWAPFHYDRRRDGLAEPWRVHWLDHTSCRRLGNALPQLIPGMKPGNKMPALLAGCGCLMLFTWLPNSAACISDPRKRQRTNQEHLAATAAAVQNFLLLLTAQRLKSYWASGTLIADHLYPELGIPEDSELAAAVFVHYPGGSGQVEILEGKQRAQRSPDQAWITRVEYPTS